MGEAIKFDLLNLGGGLNQGLPATHLKDNEFDKLLNFYSYANRLVRRKGTTKVTVNAYSEALSSVFAYKNAAGTWTLIVGSLSGVGRLDSGNIVALTVTDSQVYGSRTDAWQFKQYRDTILACRRGTGTLKRALTDNIRDAGIAAPTASPSLAEGAAGDLLAGAYIGVFTYANETPEGALVNESNPSPNSATVTIAGSKKINWSAVTVSPNPQVNTRRLYRTLVGQTNTFFFVDKIKDNFTTVFTGDNQTAVKLGRAVSYNNGLPPANIEIIEIWNERAFLSDGRDIFFSETGLVEAYGATSLISVTPDDGHKMRALLAFGDRIIIGKTNGIHYLVGTDKSSFAVRTLSDRHGCVARDSMKTAEGLLFWFGGDNIYRSDGNAVNSISTLKVRTFLDSIPQTDWEKATAAVFPSLSRYILSFPTGTLLYNYREDTWATYNYQAPAVSPSYMGDFYDSGLQQVLYATFPNSGYVYQLDKGATDDGSSFTCTARGKEFSLEQQGLFKAVRRIYLLADTVNENITIRVYRDGTNLVTTKTAGLSQVPDRPWKLYNGSSLGSPGATFRIELEYSGNSALEIKAMAIEAVRFVRKLVAV